MVNDAKSHNLPAGLAPYLGETGRLNTTTKLLAEHERPPHTLRHDRQPGYGWTDTRVADLVVVLRVFATLKEHTT